MMVQKKKSSRELVAKAKYLKIKPCAIPCSHDLQLQQFLLLQLPYLPFYNESSSQKASSLSTFSDQEPY